MQTRYSGLPAAANVEQSIILAQVVILRDLERQSRSGVGRAAATRTVECSRELLPIKRRYAA